MAGRPHGPGTRAGTRYEMPAIKVATTILHVGGLGWASEKAVVERVLGRRPGVRAVAANPVSQTATVSFDTAQTSVAELRRWVEECGYHCAGQSVPSHVCDPMAEPGPPDGYHAVTAGRAEAAASALETTPGRTGRPAAHPGHEAGVAEAPPARAGDQMAAAEHPGHEMAAGEGMPLCTR